MLKIVKQWWLRYSDVVIATVIGFFVGLSLAAHAPKQAVLVQNVVQATHHPIRYRTYRAPAIFWIDRSTSVSSVSTSSSSPPTAAAPVQGIKTASPVVQKGTPPKKMSVSAAKPAVPHPTAPPATAPIKGASLPAVQLRPAVPEPPAGKTPPAATQTSSSAATVTPVPLTTTGFPAFGKTVYPVSHVPNWGGMHAAAEWNRPYNQMAKTDLVAVPTYDLAKLDVPFKQLVDTHNEEEITRKLFYSTKFLGKYDLDAGEYTGTHPGVDLKLALGTPIGAIAGGRVYRVTQDDTLGLHVIIEHHIGKDVYYSIYGHFGSAAVQAGDTVQPGQFIGTVGSTGSTTGPHLHLQVDKGHDETVHAPYEPAKGTAVAEAERWTVNPIGFIAQYSHGV